MPKGPTTLHAITEANHLLQKALHVSQTNEECQELVEALQASMFHCTIASLWLHAPDEMRDAEYLGRKSKRNQKTAPSSHSEAVKAVSPSIVKTA